MAGRAGYGLIQSPMFEDVGVFQRVGEGTDVVRKEMYDFADKGGRHLALRPEGTASVARAFVQHRPADARGRSGTPRPASATSGPRPTATASTTKLGVEAIGSADPDLDVEVIALLADFYAALGLRQVDLVLNSIGTPADRVGLHRRAAHLPRDRHRRARRPTTAAKIDDHPMRVLDSKRPETTAVVADAPLLLDCLSAEAADHFERVQAGLTAAGLGFRIDPRLVRGLDYYTHTAFEFQSGALGGAQNTIGGGGRYDGLVQ